jgi:hypothetical protein
VARQQITDRLIGDMISQIGERSDNSVMAPGTIFPGHADNQLLDVLVNSRSAGTSPRSVEFVSNEPSVPCQDGVGPGSSRYLAQCSTASSEANFAERRPFCVREPRSPVQLGPQDAIGGKVPAQQ